MSFEDDIKAAVAAPPPYLDVDVTVNGNLHTLRFEEMDPFEWASEADRHPARPGVMIDSRYGYNLRSLVKAVAPRTGSLVEGDTTVPVKDWPALLKAIGGNGFQRVTDAVWSLNEYLRERAVDDAKKARANSAKTSQQ
jgi:hypothetical protein